jgi:hypothetical protein
MNIPRYSAEASLYKTRRRYRVAGTPTSVGHGRDVVPQLRPIGFCMAGCDETETNPVSNAACKIGCMEGAGGGGDGVGGPTDPGCRPGCGPCRRLPGQRFRSKSCINRDCDSTEIRC